MSGQTKDALLMSKILMAICGERGKVSQLSLSISIKLPFERKLMQLWVSYITYFSGNMHLWTSLYCRPTLCCVSHTMQVLVTVCDCLPHAVYYRSAVHQCA